LSPHIDQIYIFPHTFEGGRSPRRRSRATNNINYYKNNNIDDTKDNIFSINTFDYSKNNNIHNTNNNIFNINTFDYSKNNNMHNTNNNIFLY
jgi:hypothetical protein